MNNNQNKHKNIKLYNIKFKLFLKMSSIAEKIKLKLEILEKCNFDDPPEDQNSNYTNSADESDFQIETLNLENLKENTSFSEQEKDQDHKYLIYLSEEDYFNLNNKNINKNLHPFQNHNFMINQEELN